MYIEIAGKNYKIMTTDSKNVRLTIQHNTPTIIAPADIDIDTLEQFIKNKKIINSVTEEIEYHDQPLRFFQQNYLLKIIKNSPSNKIQVKNKTVTLYCKGNADCQKRLKAWGKQFALQQLSDLISYWEQELKVLVGTIKLRTLTKNLYILHPNNNITFSSAITCLSVTELTYLTFRALAEHFAFTPHLRAAYFPEEQDMEHQIAYTLKTCQQSN